MATKPISVRISAEGGQRVRAELLQVGAAGEQMGVRLSRGSSQGGLAFQNLGFQVQDFAVQVAAGTSASQALAQQLPQLLSGFGLLGVAIGTASAVAIPLAGYFLGAGEAAEDASDKVGRLTEAVGRLQAVNDDFDVAGIDKLIDKYGELDAAVVLLMERQRQFAKQEAFAAAREAARAFEDELDGLRAGLEAFDNFSKAAAANPEWAPDAQSWREAVEEIGLTVGAARNLLAVMEDLKSANTIPEMATAAATLSGLLKGTTFEGTEFAKTLLDTEDALRQLNAAGDGIGGWLDAAIGGAGSLAAQLWDAAAAAFSVGTGTDAAAGASVAGGRSAGPGGPELDPYGFRSQLSRQARPSVVPRRASGGGGGASLRNDAEREAARIFEQTRTEAEKYAAELERLNELQSQGFLSSDTYSRALDDLTGSLSDAASYSRSLENSFESAFTSFVTGASSAKEAAAQLLGQLASLFAQSAFRQLIGGGGLFGAVGGFLAGGRAGGGPVEAGSSYMVGERGPERIFMTGNGYVVPNEALRGSGAGGGVSISISIDARGAVEGTAEQIDRRLRAFMPDMQRQAVAAVIQANGRGYSR